MYKQIVFVSLIITASAFAKDHKPYQTGTLRQMESVQCGFEEKDGKSLTGEIIGIDSTHKKTRALLCQEYILETEKVIYHIRPRDEKHPVLLPVGDHAQFRIQKDKMILRVEDLDDKDRDYVVVSMTPRSDAEQATAEQSRD